MAEQRVAYLYDAANSLPGSSAMLRVLKSHYMTTCKVISKGQELPAEQFGAEKRCSHCGLEWSVGGYRARVLPLRPLKKRARRKLLQSAKKNADNKEIISKVNNEMRSNSLEKLCHLCHHKTVIKTLKPSLKGKQFITVTEKRIPQINNAAEKKVIDKCKSTESKVQKPIIKNDANVYCDSKSVFSDSKKSVKVDGGKTLKKGSRKFKKDKFAGLCKEAVLAMAKGKQCIDSTDSKLNLFLRKSS